MELVPLDVNGNPIPQDPNAPVITSTSAAASAREKRYRELLAASSTQGNGSETYEPPPPPEDENPSILDRIATPIANALGMRSPQPRAVPTQQPAQQRPQTPREDSGETPRDPGKKEDPPKAEPKDQDSDTQPPRLMSADFTPPQVQDGEQTMLAVMVTDDLSGVRHVSGVVVGPSGAQQGFACQREGDSNRFVSRITVPKDAAEGVWNVKYLTITDNARNSANFNAAQGTLPPSASFRVVSPASDSRGPTLKGVTIDTQSMRAGEKTSVFVTAEDDKSGVALISGVFVSPKKQARIGFGCRAGEGGVWNCPISPPECVDCGTWQLEQIQMQDKANNMTIVRTDNPNVGAIRLELFGDNCDDQPPVLASIAVTPQLVSNAEDSLVRVTVVANDNQCGVASLSGQAAPPAGSGSQQRLPFPFKSMGDGQTFVGEITVPKHAASGLWSIVWIQAVDKGHNLKAYSQSDPVVARGAFQVE